MKTEAVVLRTHGGPEVLVRETIELPEPGPREVRVRVRAVALNHLDLWVRRGLPNLKLEYPHRLGSDIVGEVDSARPGRADGAQARATRSSSARASRAACASGASRGRTTCAASTRSSASTRTAATRATSSSPTRTSCLIPATCPFTAGRRRAARLPHGVADGRGQGARASGPDGARAGGGQRRLERGHPDREALRRARHRDDGQRREGRARARPRRRRTSSTTRRRTSSPR